MADTVDELQIKINAESSKANDSIDRLVDKLDRLTSSLDKVNGSQLTGLANGVQRLGNAMQVMNTVKTADFTRLASNLAKLGNINTQSLNTSASSIITLSKAFNTVGGVSQNAVSLGDWAKNISKLGNKSVQNAITNIPALGNSLNSLMMTLSKAPSVSNNLIQMTNALANLSAQGSKIKTASNVIAGGLNQTSSASDKAKSSFNGLASAIGKFYASYFMIVRGMKKLWGSITDSMDYIETLNYFDAGFGQVAQNADLSAFSELGYKSAEEYYNSFSERAKELTSKMTGFNINSDGTLTATGGKSLGIDPERLMNYQAMFGQMSSSIGVTSETALKLSDALSMIGADLASVKNMDFDKVWTDMASGLAGMSRTLDKYGVNIRNVNLQQELTNLGINANIQSLNQNEKALLRATILLNSTKYAWGDLANTLNLPANQLRLLSANFQNLGRTIGNLFLPVLQRVLPVLNGVVIALQRLVSWVGNLLGIDIGKITNSIGSGSDNISDFLDSSEGVSDALGEATKNAKKLKNATLGIDELNIISPEDNSGSGSVSSGGGGIGSGLLDDAFLDAYNKYKQAWDSAFANMENKANEFANKIEKALEPLKTIFLDFAKGDFYQAGADVSKLVIGITDFFANAIDKVDWYGIGRKMGDFLAGIDWLGIFASVGNLMWQALKAAFELALGVFDSAPLEATIISLIALPKLFKKITATKFVSGFLKLGEAIKLTFSALSGNQVALASLTAGFPKLGKAVDVGRKAISNFRFGIENGNWITGFNEGIKTIRDNLTKMQKGAIVAASGIGELIATRSALKGLVDGSKDTASAILEIGVSAGTASIAMYTALGPAGLAVAGVTALVGGIIGIGEALSEIDAERTGRIMKDALSEPGGVSIDELTSHFVEALQNASSGFDKINEKASEMDSVKNEIEDTWASIESVEESMRIGITSVEDGKAQLEKLFSDLASSITTQLQLMNETIILALGQNGAFREYMKSLGVDVDAVLGAVMGYTDEIQQRITEINEELSNTAPDTEKYKELREELYNITAEASGSTTAVEDFRAAIEGIDYTDIVLDDGSFDADKLKSYLKEVSGAVDDAYKSIDESAKEMRIALKQVINSAYSTDAQKKAAQAALDVLPETVKKAKKDVQVEAKSYTNEIQRGLIDKINNVINNASDKWDKMDWWEHLTSGVNTKDDYIQSKVTKFKEDMDSMSDEIESEFSELGIEGAGWGKDTMQKIYDSLFTVDPTGVGIYKLKDNYQEEMQKLIDEINKDNEKTGVATVGAFVAGIQSATPSANQAVKDYASNVNASMNDSNTGIASTVSTAGTHGKNAVMTYNKSIAENQNSSVAQHKSWINTMMSFLNGGSGFSTILANTSGNGKKAVLLFNTGIAQNKESSKAQATNWMSMFKKAIEDSPMSFASSKPMAWLFGQNTVLGFNKGIEDNKESSKSVASKWMSGFVTAFHDGIMNFGSPSKTMEGFGKDTVDGYNNGIVKNASTSLDVIDTFSRDIVSAFNVAPVGIADSIAKIQAIEPNIGIAPVQTRQFDYAYNSVITDNTRSEMIGQMKEAVREVVEEFIQPTLNDIAQNTRDTADKELNVAIGDKEIYKASIRGARTSGKLIVT